MMITASSPWRLKTDWLKLKPKTLKTQNDDDYRFIIVAAKNRQDKTKDFKEVKQ
jgi:hypothetical protein